MSPAQNKTESISSIRSVRKDRNYVLLGSLFFIAIVGAVYFTVTTKNLLNSEPQKKSQCEKTEIVGYVPKNGTQEQRIEAAINNIFEKMYPDFFLMYNKKSQKTGVEDGIKTEQETGTVQDGSVIVRDTAAEKDPFYDFTADLQENYKLNTSFIKKTPGVKSISVSGGEIYLDLYFTPGFTLNINVDKKYENKAYIDCDQEKIKTAISNTLKQHFSAEKVTITSEGMNFPCYYNYDQACREKIYELGKSEYYMITAEEGDQMINLALKAAGIYIKQKAVFDENFSKLNTNQVSYLENQLSKKYGTQAVFYGEIAEFPYKEISEIVNLATELGKSHNSRMLLTGTAYQRADTIHSGYYKDTGASQYKKPVENWRFGTNIGYLDRCFILNDGVIIASGNNLEPDAESTQTKYFTAIDTKDGQKLFSSKIDAKGIKGCPVSKDNYIYYISEDKYLKSLDLATGKTIWQFKLDFPEYETSPVISDDIIYVGSKKFIYAVDLNGNAVWEYGAGGNIKGELYVLDNKLIFNSDDGFFYSLDKNTGKEMWKSTGKIMDESVPNNLITTEQISPIEAEIKSGMADNIIILRTNGSVVAVNSENGRKYWDYNDCETVGIPAVDENNVYISCSVTSKPNGDLTGFGGLVAVNKFTGEELWNFETKYFESGSPIVVGDYVYFRTRLGEIYSLRSNTGKETWSISTGDNSYSNLIVDDDNLYFVGDRFLFAFN